MRFYSFENMVVESHAMTIENRYAIWHQSIAAGDEA